MKPKIVDLSEIKSLSSTERTALSNKTIENHLIENFQNKDNYDIFFEAAEGEELKNFEVFKHYVLIELISERREFFKG